MRMTSVLTEFLSYRSAIIDASTGHARDLQGCHENILYIYNFW